MSKIIVAIGGGENGRIGSDGTKYPYETMDIDKEIIKLSGKDKPNFLMLTHSQIEYEGKFGVKSEESYAETMKRIYKDLYDCNFKWLSVNDLESSLEKTKEYVEWADIIYEGGGNTFDMMKFWNRTGFDEVLKKAYEAGKIMCGISAGAICWFESGFTDDPRFKDKVPNEIKGLGLVDAYFSPHCQKSGKREKINESIKHLNKIGISLSNCCAIEIIDDKYRIITSSPEDKRIKPYALKTYINDGNIIEEEIISSEKFNYLKDLLK